MRNFNEFSALLRAPIFSKALFQDAALNWRGIGIRHLLLLVMATWLAVLIQWTFGMSGFLQHDAPAALKDFPAIKIAGGVASSDVDQPYIMKDDHGTPIFVLDTTGETKLPADVGATLLLTSTELIQQDPSGYIQRRPLSAFPDMNVDQAWILSWIKIVRNGMVPGGLAVCGGFSFAYRLVLALVFAAIGLAFNAMFKGGLKYSALLRLSILAMTGPVILDTVLWLLHIPTACWSWFLFNGLTLGYLAYAVKAASEVVPPAEPSPLRPPGITPTLPRTQPRSGSDIFP